jgi:transglutaminase superfamily protein
MLPHGGVNAYATLPPDQAVHLARQEIFPCQLITRALIPNALCLPRSLALATYLTTLGLPAQVIVARGLTTAVPRNTFHAWTELYGTVVNDNPDVQLGYTTLQRVPSTKRNQPN